MRKLTLYFVTVASTQAMGFLTFPLIAKNLSVSEFGRYSLLLSIAGLIGGFTTAWIRNVAFRTYYDAKRGGETGNYLRLYLSLQATALAVTSTLAFVIARLLGADDLSLSAALITLAFVASGDVYALLLNTTRAEELARTFAVAENTLAILRLIGIVLLIQFDLLSANTILLAYAVILILGAASLFLNLSPRLLSRPDPESLEIRTILGLGIRAMPLSVAGWVIAASDRIIVDRFLGTEQLGIYAANYSAADRIIGGLAAAAFMFI